MHITLETDYAIRIVDLLAKTDEPNSDAKSISERTGVSHRNALKILRKLVAGEIVKSRRGAHGGYSMSRNPCEVSLYDVVEIMEGGYKFSRCLEADYNCSAGCKCGYQAVFADISKLVQDKLKNHKFG
jgi:Rrf2 family protein